MPYIPEDRREQYDLGIELLATSLLKTREEHGDGVLAGELNYTIFRLAKILCHDKTGAPIGYAGIATVLSAMNEAQHEIRRRVLASYEDVKIKTNNDVSI